MSFFIRNALGFFIQLYPCALLIFLPFHEETYRFRRKSIFTWMTIISVALALVFPTAWYAAINAGTNYGLVANLFMLAAIVLILAAYIWLIRDAVIKKLLVFSIVLFYAATQYLLVNLAMCFIQLPEPSLSGSYPIGVLLMYAVSAAVLLPLMLGVVIRPIRDFIREIEPKQMRREFCLSLLSTIVYLGLMFCFSNIWGVYIDKSSWLIYSVMFLFLMLNQCLIFWLVFRESVRRKRDSERQRFLEVQRLQYEKIAGEMESTSRLRHDLRHHLNALGALNAQGRQEEIAEYLRQYGAVYDQLGKRNICADPVVDSVLEYYIAHAKAAEASVDCRVSLTGGTGVEPADMMVLLGNCLENALEALRQLSESQRRLSIEMMNAHAAIVLCIKNTCKAACGSREPTGWEAFASTKGTGHTGVGLRSVTAIAEKYDGSAQFQCRDGVFTTRMILNPTQKRAEIGDRP